MLRAEGLANAVEGLFSAALLGEGWDEALTVLSEAAGARGVALIRNRERRLVGAMTNREIEGPIRDYLAGRAPPSSRQVRVSHDRRDGFRVDFDDYTPEQLDHDPFYQDFLRPIGMFWHANARLQYVSGDEVAISFKRDLGRGPYDRRDAGALDRILPGIKSALRVAHRMLDAEAAGIVRLLRGRGDPVIEIDSWGRALRADDAELTPAHALRVVARRIVAADRTSQRRLDDAIHLAVSARQAGLVELAAPGGARSFLQLIPVAGAARDVFGAAAAVAILIDSRRPSVAFGERGRVVQNLFGVTDREWQVLEALMSGATLDEIATAMHIQARTARFHLGRLFEKTGTSRQADLVNLVGRLAS